ncbi:NAD(P)H-hydrate dehydratase [Pseudoalteromonas obscura]|uniref:Bifunctional NAD(P)H-hydrate repair enzyme n=1 Tax=Pseudoalteromonas obscura TaxID=3048491 RepID=A0ABT7ELR5_9GAMM|nr:NAD(P)H-hydrate dehydratase [Pseudoalteromonas sp. P94(2023)]MDK2595992.1 NAD(P)H-hydrate dehydratase [Pseudoalteromonas sp. P94(2023)]
MQGQYTHNLPQIAYCAQEVKLHEEQAALNSGTTLSELMQRAGHALFELVRNKAVKNILIFTGKGNNAGDGFMLAKRCLHAQINVTVCALFEPSLLKGDAGEAYQLFCRSGGRVVALRSCIDRDFDAIVDAVFGTGFRGELPDSVKEAFGQFKSSKAWKLAVDIPSGVNGSTAEVAPDSFDADTTLTFIALKQGMLTGSAASLCGELLLADLGIAQAFEDLSHTNCCYPGGKYLHSLKPKRSPDSYKNQCGHVLLVGGGKGMAGAIRLAAEACLRTGAGLVSVATHPDNQATVLNGRYELMVHGISLPKELDTLLDKADVVVIGPGLGQDAWAKKMYAAVKNFKGLVVCDADGLNLLAQSHLPWHRAILTPHFGEARRLLGNTTLNMSKRFEMAEQLSKEYAACIVLKGPGSLIVDGKRININRSGCSAMASAGMGDVLSGIIAGLLAQGLSRYEAATLGVYIHGLAAEQAARDGHLGMLASDLFDHIRGIMG